jgi:hypothetical protein
MVFESEQRDQSEFNMAVSYLNRLNSLFYAADEAAIRSDMFQWFSVLSALSRELSTEMKAPEVAEFDTMEDQINNDLNTWQKRSAGRPNKVGGGMFQNVDYNLRRELIVFERKLRGVLKSSGLQQKMKEDRRFGL